MTTADKAAKPSVKSNSAGTTELMLLPPQWVIEFINTESDCADSHAYEKWESLWAVDEGTYWVCGPGQCDDPKLALKQVSLLLDNRARIGSRMRQLRTNRRVSQLPVSSLSRVVSNYRLAEDSDPAVVACWVNFQLAEYRTEQETYWAGRILYRLRETPAGPRMIEKRVVLFNRSGLISTFTFIL
ncbi:Ring-hydroxylating dioxygenase subunit beta [Burkholderia orbicola]